MRTQGFLLVEIILASSLFILFLTAFAGVFYYGIESSSLAGDRSRAIMYAEEGQEAVRSIKNTYSNNAWSFLGSQDVSGGLTRQVTVSTIDANRKNIAVTISWQQTPARTGSVTTYARLTNWKTILNLGVGVTVNKIVINHGLSKVPSDFAPYKVGTTSSRQEPIQYQRQQILTIHKPSLGTVMQADRLRLLLELQSYVQSRMKKSLHILRLPRRLSIMESLRRQQALRRIKLDQQQ
jgi:type II secretory pathway pseudopilin PulG